MAMLNNQMVYSNFHTYPHFESFIASKSTPKNAKGLPMPWLPPAALAPIAAALGLPWCWSQFVGFLIFIISLPWRWSIFIIFSHDLYKGLSLFLPATWRTFSLGVDISLQKDGSRILPNLGQDWCTWMNSTNQWLNVGISNGIYIYNKHLEFIISKSWKKPLNLWTFRNMDESWGI